MEHAWRPKPLPTRRETRLWECAACRETAFGLESPRGGSCGGIRPATFEDLPCGHRGVVRLVKADGCPSCPATAQVAPCAAQGDAPASVTGFRFKDGPRRIQTLKCWGCALQADEKTSEIL